MTTPYNSDFFNRMDQWAVDSAAVITPLVYELLRPKSVLDLGGGTGAWTAAFAAQGVTDYLCADGDYVDRNALRVAPDRFKEVDLSRPIDLRRRYDLALCLEVAEHLPDSSADALITSLIRHADAVLFSAAIPHQGGTHHVNEQWPEYWARLFRVRGFRCFDCIRWPVWTHPRVSWWYKQNTLLYLSDGVADAMDADAPLRRAAVDVPPAVVHPDVYLSAVTAIHNMQSLEATPRLPWAVRAFAKSARASLRYHAGKILSPNR